MKDKRAQEAFNEIRKRSARRFGLIYLALKYGGMDGMKREIVKLTKRP